MQLGDAAPADDLFCHRPYELQVMGAFAFGLAVDEVEPDREVEGSENVGVLAGAWLWALASATGP